MYVHVSSAAKCLRGSLSCHLQPATYFAQSYLTPCLVLLSTPSLGSQFGSVVGLNAPRKSIILSKVGRVADVLTIWVRVRINPGVAIRDALSFKTQYVKFRAFGDLGAPQWFYVWGTSVVLCPGGQVVLICHDSYTMIEMRYLVSSIDRFNHQVIVMCIHYIHVGLHPDT